MAGLRKGLARRRSPQANFGEAREELGALVVQTLIGSSDPERAELEAEFARRRSP